MRARNSLIPTLVGAAILVCAALPAWATSVAQTSQHISGLAPEPGLPFPSVTRVVTAAIVTIVLAVAILVGARRLLPGVTNRREKSGETIKVIARSSVGRSLQVHLLEVDASRVLIVEGRGGVELAVLPRSEKSGSSSS